MQSHHRTMRITRAVLENSSKNLGLGRRKELDPKLLWLRVNCYKNKNLVMEQRFELETFTSF
ncbi:hypothetical protein Hanom_Chr09g00793701 [Helianthus anomalus]